ncbi:MAG TPA: RNA polymerase-binding protein DksA [Gammaproteobacteria bacterium]|nr:RNA polymerase-binding protein DksA [Gammaproteobacteria bacterium]
MARTRTTVSKLIHGIEPYKPAKGEEYLNSNQQAHFRQILEAWRDELLAGSSKTVSSMQDETINHPDPTDRASQETEISLELRSRDRERKLLKKINESLDLLETDDYGYCEKCGIDIGLKRLEARPTATLCIDCKTLEEIRERNQA